MLAEAQRQLIETAIASHGLPTRRIARATHVYRVQHCSFKNPIYYNRNSDSRYGDPQLAIGVCYVALSDIVAVAETLQHGRAGSASPVLCSEIAMLALHELKATRELVVVDAGALARNAGSPLQAIVASKGQGSVGYLYTQLLSGVVMRHAAQVDGILYPSQVYPITASLAGCNLVLFEGRADQLAALRCRALDDLLLSTGETVGEALLRTQVAVQ
ncbi:RES family NAD+ phosphorylase [Pseudomonas sp. GZD-209]|uniref:RES family NAD+ phosphorylase n=1 Tax=Pseudomonas sp. GZD-209 TaxID=3404807 RepID=UPI003BB62829